MSKVKKTSSSWKIRFDQYDPEDEGRRESLLALGNGYIVSRAASPESKDDGIHYPGTYSVGCYNTLISHIQGREVKNESMVNLPNWLPLSFRIEQGDWFSMDEVTILEYRQTLNMQHGLLTRTIYFSDRQGRKTRFCENRFISMDQPNLMAMSLELSPQNWSGTLDVRTGLDGRVSNSKVRRYRPYNSHHLDILKTYLWNEDSQELLARTNQSNVSIALAARTQIFVNDHKVLGCRSDETETDYVFSTQTLTVKAGEKITIEKIAALFTSHSLPMPESSHNAREAVRQAPAFSKLLKAHKAAWKKLWERCHLEMDDDEQLRYFRLHIFHILQNLSPYTAELDAGVPPSGWQGEEYHGQVFWDELFIFPFLTFHFPDSACALLRYRYRRLDAARQMAQESGYKGAMFPWRSASDGYEETPPLQFNPLSGHWMQDFTYLQRHIGAIIAYNIWYYVQVTADETFLEEYGAELFLEIARFWGSIASYNHTTGRYEIHGIAGPDEYHTLHPDTQMPGLSNNTFTNLMAVWTLSHARIVFDKLSPQRQEELRVTLELSLGEFDQWETISRSMLVVFNDDGTLCQFEGFENLKEFDQKAFRKKYGKERIDWLLEKQGDSVERYRVSKQADTPLLLYLFSPKQLIALLERNGYTMTEELFEKTLLRHQTYTTHESSLSKIVYAGAFARFNLIISWDYFKQAQQVDMSPEDKGTAEGIHLGAMGGTLAVLQHHYLGCKAQPDALYVKHNLPEELGNLQYSMVSRGVEYVCRTENNSINLSSELSNS